MAIETNVKPYYDDFDPSKNYHKILFVPGRPLQARELTQMQSMIQNQIKAAGDFLLKNGSMVIPGHIFYDNNITSLKLEKTFNGNQVDGYLSQFDGGSIVGASSSVKAEVVTYSLGEGNDAPTLYVKFKSGGNAFTSGETIVLDDGTGSVRVQLQNNGAAGSSLVTIKEGIYYINGYFVQVLEQKLILDKYSNRPSYIVGLELNDSIVTTKEDETLFDNSRGFNDFITVGADRYKVALTLVKRPFVTEIETNDSNEVKFIDLMQIKDGIVLQKKDKSTFGEIEAALARRTYDESGDYTITPHKISAQHYRNNIRGAWAAGVAYLSGDVVTSNGKTYECLNGNISGTIAPSHTSGIASDGNLDWLQTSVPYKNFGAVDANNSESYDVQTANDGKVQLNVTAGKSYIKGYEVETQATSLVAEKPRTFIDLNSQSIDVDAGLYFIVDSVTGVPDFSNVEQLTIKNATNHTVGTCRARSLEPIGNGQYKLYVFDLQFPGTTTYGSHVRQNTRYSDGFKTFAGASFAATGVVELIPVQGTVNTSSTTVNGFGTLFTDLSEGDGIKVGNVTAGISTITDANAMTVSTSLGTQTGQILYRLVNRVQGVSNCPAVMLPVVFTRTLHVNNQFDTTYITRRVFTSNISSNSVTISVPNGSYDQFAAGNLNYVVIKNDGTHVTPTTAVLSNSNQTITLGITATNQACKVIAAISKTNNAAVEKTKLLKVKTVQFTTYNSVKAAALSLTEADIQNIVSVKKNSTGATFSASTPTTVIAFNPSATVDITSSFTLDSGITAEYYGMGKLVKNANVIIDRPIEVTFEYFEHSAGDYFSVDSYRNIPYHRIPQGCADMLDFRPRIADDGTWTGSGRSIPEPMSTQSFFSYDVSYYLGRRDLVVVHHDGRFEIIPGDASATPRLPTNVPNDSIVIAEINYAPYTGNINMVEITEKSTKRYTMKDIGSIDDRLKNVEYYTALSLLEKKTQDQKITDAYGMDRYKNGFLTDSFERHESGFTSHPDYSNSIDPDKGELRPFFVPNNVRLYEARPASRAAQNYTVTGDLATLPYTTTPVLSQTLASKSMLINPFAVYGFKGVTSLFPSEDNWVDTQQLPDIIVRKEGNFSTIQSLATKAGILGTQWGSWRETGRTLVSVSGFNSVRSTLINQTTSQSFYQSALHSVADWNAASVNRGWWNGILRRENIQYTNVFNNYLVETTHTDVFGWNVGAQRTGTNTYVQESWDETGRETKLIDSKFIPFMRPRPVLIQSRGMKPFTALHVNIDKKAFTNLSSTVSIVLKPGFVGTFMGYDDTEILNDTQLAREDMWYGNQFYWDRGDVIKLSNGASAVVVGVDVEMVGAVLRTVLKVHNIRSPGVTTQSLYNNLATYLPTNATFTGSISGASGAIESWYANGMTTNSVGNLWVVPYLTPNTFRCGNVDVVVSDVPDGAPNSASTWSKALYTAQGRLDTKQTTITTVRNGQIVSVPVTQSTSYYETTSTTRAISSTVVSTKETIVTNRWFDDPLAQTFAIQDEGGCFVTSIDIFFHTVDVNIPVTVEIRDVVNGYPGPNIVPLAQVVKPGAQIVANQTGLTRTNFKFRSPIYLQPGVEYAVVVRCDSNKTKIWVAGMGDRDITNPGRIISEQPLTGSLFKSQNNSAWIAEPLEDMTLVIHKAVFNTATEGEMALFNMPVPFDFIGNNPLTTLEGTKTVRVDHVAHGMKNGDRVVFAGSDDSYINSTTFTVANAQFESYTIQYNPVGSVNFTSTSKFGGNVFASKNFDANTIRFNGNDMAVAGTKIRYAFSVATNRTMPDLEVCQFNKDITLTTPSEILSDINASTFLSSTNVVAGIVNKPIVFDVFMSSVNPNVSPVFDLQSASVTTIANQINVPTEAMNTGHNNATILSSTTVTFGANFITTTDTNLFDEFDMFDIGKTIVVSGSRTGTTFITNIESDSTSRKIYTDKADWTTGDVSVTIVQKNDFVREIAPTGSSSLFKYIAQPMDLANVATGINVYFDYNKQSNDASISVYYKTSKKSLSENILTKPWIYHNPAADEGLINVPSTESFVEAKFAIDNLEEFDQVMVKIVGNSDKTEIIPRIKNLRIIALA